MYRRHVKWYAVLIAEFENDTKDNCTVIKKVQPLVPDNSKNSKETFMKKIVFCDIPMKSELTAMKYTGTGNVNSKYDKPVIFPVNAVLAENIQTDDEVKVILLQTHSIGYNGKNSGLFMDELDAINEEIGAKITCEMLDSGFIETKDTHAQRLNAMLDKVEEGSQIFCDITYGPKPLPMILMCVLSFAEKFLQCDIKNIVYGKVNFVDGKAENPELYDITSLYYLNNLTNAMSASNSKEARQILDEFFAL